MVKMETISGNTGELTGTTSSGSCWMRGTRYIVLISTLICLASIMSNIVTFNFTVLCISPQQGEDLSHANKASLLSLFRKEMFKNLISILISL